MVGRSSLRKALCLGQGCRLEVFSRRGIVGVGIGRTTLLAFRLWFLLPPIHLRVGTLLSNTVGWDWDG